MARKSYVDIIAAIEDEQTIQVIGKIDKDILNAQIVESLYYIFPLIERIVLEIYKLIPDADIEHYQQGVRKTLLSIINNNRKDILPSNIIATLQKYYDDDGLRNELFHVTGDTFEYSVSFDELNYLIMHLLSILKRLLNDNVICGFEDIELLQ